MVDEWVNRYQAGESLNQIARNELSPVTVLIHLRRRGLPLRDRVEAQIKAVTKHRKTSFAGKEAERAYIIGLRIGDLHAVRHGRAVRVRVSTTHPAMIELFSDIFSEHGPIYKYPKKSPLTEFEWSLECDLNSSFEFLLDPNAEIRRIVENEALFLAFLAGFFDADGSIYYHKKATHGGFEFALTNMDAPLLRMIAERLGRMGFHPRLRLTQQEKDRGVEKGSQAIWRLSLWRHEEVSDIIRRLPTRHSEKTAKRDLALQFDYRQAVFERALLIREWEQLKSTIKEGCSACIRDAETAYEGATKPRTAQKV